MGTFQEFRDRLQDFYVKNPQSDADYNVNNIIDMVLDAVDTKGPVPRQGVKAAIRFVESIQLNYTFTSETIKDRLQREGLPTSGQTLIASPPFQLKARELLGNKRGAPQLDRLVLFMQSNLIKQVPVWEDHYHAENEEGLVDSEAVREWSKKMGDSIVKSAQGIRDIKRGITIAGKSFVPKSSDEEVRAAVRQLVVPSDEGDKERTITDEDALKEEYILEMGQDLNRVAEQELIESGHMVNENGDLEKVKLTFLNSVGTHNWRRTNSGEIVMDINVKANALFKLPEEGIGQAVFMDSHTRTMKPAQGEGFLQSENEMALMKQAKNGELPPVFEADFQIRLDVENGQVVPKVTAMSIYSYAANLESEHRLQQHVNDFIVLDDLDSEGLSIGHSESSGDEKDIDIDPTIRP